MSAHTCITRSARNTAFGALSRLLLTVAIFFPATACKKKPAPQPSLASSADALAQLNAHTANSAPEAAFGIPGSKNISIDGGTDSFAHVTYAPAVKTFDLSEVQSSLQGISSDGHGFVFKNASSGIRALQAGDVLVVKGELAVKVLGAITQDDTTLIETDQASIADVVQTGEINIDAPIRFHGPKQSAAIQPPAPRHLFDFLIPPVYAAQSGLTGSGADVARQQGTTDAARNAASAIGKAITDGWKITQWSAVAGDGQLNFHLVMSKDTEGYVAMVAMKGWVGNFDFASNLKIDRSAPSKVFQGVKNTTGNIQFDWEIGKASPGVWAKEDRVKLPAAISIPLAPLLGGMPLTLDVSSALLIHPALTGGNEYSKGGFAISWGNGNLETSKTGGAVSDGNTIETTYNITDDQSISPVAPNAMVISYCAPRIELRFDVLGKLADSVTQLGSGIDTITSKLLGLMPASIQSTIANSPISKITANNILTSNADIYIQFIATEGVTHASNMTLAPCSKQEIKFDADGGIGAQLFGITPGAQKSTNLFTKTYTRWNPATDFCKKV